jgi:hypothetical protein
VPIVFSSYLQKLIAETIKHMPSDVDFVEVRECPSFYVSRIMISNEEAKQNNLLRLKTINGEECDAKDYFIYQSLGNR